MTLESCIIICRNVEKFDQLFWYIYYADLFLLQKNLCKPSPLIGGRDCHLLVIVGGWLVEHSESHPVLMAFELQGILISRLPWRVSFIILHCARKRFLNSHWEFPLLFKLLCWRESITGYEIWMWIQVINLLIRIGQWRDHGNVSQAQHPTNPAC